VKQQRSEPGALRRPRASAAWTWLLRWLFGFARKPQRHAGREERIYLAPF